MNASATLTTATASDINPSNLAAYLTSIRWEGEQLARVADSGDLDSPIGACPEWNLRDLIRHVGMVHLWAAANITHPIVGWLSVNDLSDLAEYWPEHTAGWPPDDQLGRWYRSALTVLIDVLDHTPADHECLTFLPATTPLMMWARRQASEIAVHRFDAEASQGWPSSFDAPFSLDMLDELLSGFTTLMRGVPDAAERQLLVSVKDADVDFHITMGPSGIRTTRERGPADLRISGSAADLYIFMWNRPAGATIELEGDDSVLAQWRRSCRIEWL